MAGAYRIEYTSSVCPASTRKHASRFSDHSRIVRSALELNNVEVEANSTAQIAPKCPINRVVKAPEDASNTQIVLSTDLDMINNVSHVMRSKVNRIKTHPDATLNLVSERSSLEPDLERLLLC